MDNSHIKLSLFELIYTRAIKSRLNLYEFNLLTNFLDCTAIHYLPSEKRAIATNLYHALPIPTGYNTAHRQADLLLIALYHLDQNAQERVAWKLQSLKQKR